MDKSAPDTFLNDIYELIYDLYHSHFKIVGQTQKNLCLKLERLMTTTEDMQVDGDSPLLKEYPNVILPKDEFKSFIKKFIGDRDFEISLVKIIISLASSSKIRVNWTLVSRPTMVKLMDLVASHISIRDSFITIDQRLHFLNFLKKLFSSLDHENIAEVVGKYTSLAIALRFSRLTIKDMIMVEQEEADEDEEPIITQWKNLSQVAGRIYSNPKVTFISFLIEQFWEVIRSTSDSEEFASQGASLYQSFIEFILILVSQNETKKYLKYLVQDTLFIYRIKKEEIYHSSIVIQQLVQSLESYLDKSEESAYANLTLMKKLAFKYFPTELANSSNNHQNESGSLVGRQYIQRAMEDVKYEIVHQIAQKLRINTYMVDSLHESTEERREALIELIGEKLESKNIISSGNSVVNTPSMISENELYDEENSTIPIILNHNSQDIMDYSFRMFHESRRELANNIKKQINLLNDNIQPQFDINGNFDGYESWHKDAAPLNYCRILSVKIGRNMNDKITAEAEFDISSFTTNVQEMWLNLRAGEILAFVQYIKTKQGVEVGTLRLGEVESIVYSSQNPEKRKDERQGYILDQKLRVYILFDPVQFKEDQQRAIDDDFNLDDIYQEFHITMRMQREDSAIKHALDKIKAICHKNKGFGQNDEQIYDLKFDDPDDEEYVNFDDQLPYHKLFVDREEFAKKFIENADIPERIRNNYILNFGDGTQNEGVKDFDQEAQIFCSYNLTNTQVKAIMSGIGKKVTMLTGEPGTGKSSVIIQISFK